MKAKIGDMDYIAYYRVSTPRQGMSGLGLKAQEAAVREYIAKHAQRRLVDSFTEIESGKRSDRPEIAKAIAACQSRKTKLIIAKLDRLARDVHFITGLKKSGVDFVACDFPDVNTFTVHILAAVAEHEAQMISERIKAALAESPKKLGGDRGHMQQTWPLGVAARQRKMRERNQRLSATVRALRTSGATLAAIGSELERLGHRAPRGGRWHPASVARILA